MLKVRVIPTLLWKGLGLVKGVAFNSWRRVGTVLPALKVYNSRDVDELVLLDISATDEQRAPEHESIADLSDECSVPLTVGGGITDLTQISALLRAGADKISVNTSALVRPEFVEQAATRFGTQCLVVSIDVASAPDGRYSVFSHAGTRDTSRDPVEWAREAASRGAGEILLTSIERDGTMTGYDVRLVASVAAAVDIPVIASGGAGTYQHMIDVLQQGGASAVAAASMFHFTEQTPAGAKQALSAAGIPVRRNFVAV
ncbi:MAG TPA: imidazole glycerol phosphate synthase cyclase subunit [Steroidobacteraceae bacterium]|nr:imidazole glycerol phosphate synthase cyclase subunit [Steroidobacteraceae bacterium]